MIGSAVVAEQADGTAHDVRHAAFTWDDAGNLTSAFDTPAANLGGTAKDRQCYTYDGLRRLTTAWTPASAACSTAPTVEALGGAAPYWQDYTYDAVGNRKGKVEHSLPDGTAARTSTYTYPTAPAGEPVVRPHAVFQVTATGRQAGTSEFSYDDAGNMVGREAVGSPDQKLVWDPEGELATAAEDTSGDGTVSDAETAAGDKYVYTADGDRLLRTQDGKTTLYLGTQELTVNHSTGSVTGLRYYTFAGQTVAVRTGLDYSTVSSIFSDRHGTGEVQIPNSTSSRTHRYTDPFGAPRGPQASGWIGDHGFLDKPKDTSGLTAIGARMYDPALGKFIGVDPIMDLADPQQWNAYSYSNNNPTTFSDPTGKRYEECGTTHNCTYSTSGNVTSAKKYKKRKPTIWDIRSRVVSSWSTYQFSGYQDWSRHQATNDVEDFDFRYRAAGDGSGFPVRTPPRPSKAEIRKAEALRQIAYSRSRQSSAEATLRAQLGLERRLEQRDDGAFQLNGGVCAVVCVDLAAGNDDDHGRYFNVSGGYGWEFGISGGGSYAEGIAPGVSHGVSLTVPSPIGVGVNGTLTFDDDLSVSGYSSGPAITARAGGHMFVGYTITER